MLSTEDFTLPSIKYEEEITAQATEMEAETKAQQFIADFFIMSAALAELLSDLQKVFVNVEQSHANDMEAVTA